MRPPLSRDFSIRPRMYPPHVLRASDTHIQMRQRYGILKKLPLSPSMRTWLFSSLSWMIGQKPYSNWWLEPHPDRQEVLYCMSKQAALPAYVTISLLQAASTSHLFPVNRLAFRQLSISFWPKVRHFNTRALTLNWVAFLMHPKYSVVWVQIGWIRE